MGDFTGRGRFSAKMPWLRASNYGIQEACGKKHKGNTKKGLIWQGICGKVTTCEKLQIPCSFYLRQCRYAGGEGQRPKGGTTA